MRLKQIAATGVFAFLALSAAAPATSLAQSAKCNPVFESSRTNPVKTAAGLDVLHLGSYDCPPPPAPAAVTTPAPAAPPAAQLAQAEYMVFFDFDRANITPAAQEVINTVVNDFRRTNQERVNVVGHTDTSGPAAYNQRLSERRAAAVRDALVARGVSSQQITTRGAGETDLLVPTPDGVREPSNRRATIRFQ